MVRTVVFWTNGLVGRLTRRVVSMVTTRGHGRLLVLATHEATSRYRVEAEAILGLCGRRLVVEVGRVLRRQLPVRGGRRAGGSVVAGLSTAEKLEICHGTAGVVGESGHAVRCAVLDWLE